MVHQCWKTPGCVFQLPSTTQQGCCYTTSTRGACASHRCNAQPLGLRVPASSDTAALQDQGGRITPFGGGTIGAFSADKNFSAATPTKSIAFFYEKTAKMMIKQPGLQGLGGSCIQYSLSQAPPCISCTLAPCSTGAVNDSTWGFSASHFSQDETLPLPMTGCGGREATDT